MLICYLILYLKVGMLEKTAKEGPVKLHERLLNLAAASLAEVVILNQINFIRKLHLKP